jgi:hypothetical protein
VPSYGYLFTDPQPDIPAYQGVPHASDIPYIFHIPFDEFGACTTKSAASQVLCDRMLDYWLSFATSLTPNDGKGVCRPVWPKYTPSNQVCCIFSLGAGLTGYFLGAPPLGRGSYADHPRQLQEEADAIYDRPCSCVPSVAQDESDMSQLIKNPQISEIFFFFPNSTWSTLHCFLSENSSPELLVHFVCNDLW